MGVEDELKDGIELLELGGLLPGLQGLFREPHSQPQDSQRTRGSFRTIKDNT